MFVNVLQVLNFLIGIPGTQIFFHLKHMDFMKIRPLCVATIEVGYLRLSHGPTFAIWVFNSRIFVKTFKKSMIIRWPKDKDSYWPVVKFPPAGFLVFWRVNFRSAFIQEFQQWNILNVISIWYLIWKLHSLHF